MHVQKRRRSGGYVEAFAHVLSDSEASETYGYLVWVILGIFKVHILVCQEITGLIIATSQEVCYTRNGNTITR